MKLVTLFITALLLIISMNAEEKTQTVRKAQTCKIAVEEVSTAAVPAKYIKTVYKELCPISGEIMVNDLTYEYNGKTYHICCEKCLMQIKNDPEKHLVKLTSDLALKKD